MSADVGRQQGDVDRLRRRIGGGLLALLGGGSAARGELPPPSAPVKPLRPAAPFEARLPNGLRLIVAPRHAAPLVSVRLLVLSGSETDPPRRAGRAALTAALLSRGTRRTSAPALAAAAEALGGSIVSESGRHQSSVSMAVTTPMLDAALGLIAEVVMRPSFRPSELVRLRRQMLDELELTYATPAPLAAMTVERLLFGEGAYGRAVDGTPASLPRIGQRELIAMHATHFRPENAALILAGDIDDRDALQLGRRHFGDWPAVAGTAEDDASPAAALPPPQTAALAVVDFGAGGSAAIALGLRLPRRSRLSEADAAALRVANAVLGAGYSSRLNQEIRIRRGLSYGASSSLALLPNAGLLLAAVQTRGERAAEVIELLHREFDRLIEVPVDADELAARKASLIGGFARRIETTDGLAGLIATQLAHGAQPASLARYAAQIAAVDSADVQRMARACFGRADRRIAIVGDARQFVAALEGREPGLIRLRPWQIDFD